MTLESCQRATLGRAQYQKKGPAQSQQSSQKQSPNHEGHGERAKGKHMETAADSHNWPSSHRAIHTAMAEASKAGEAHIASSAEVQAAEKE